MRAHLFLLLAFVGLCTPAQAEVVTSTEVSDVVVTIYRDPRRDQGAMNPNWPGGYAVITETRTVTLPAGESQIRFENVAEGLMPETAIITGLPKGVREKNRDARLISPAGLVDAFLKRNVRIRRTDRATGKVTDQDAIIQAGPNGGVILKTAAGYEALRCSGLPERMIYPGVPDTLTARPTLSVLTRNDRPVTATVQLTYMAQGFDWSANYVANMAADGSKLGLFAWLTVANGGAQSFRNARLQVVGGKPEKKRNNPPPPPPSSWLNLQCWPMDTTSTHPDKPWYQMPMPPVPDLSVFNGIGANPPGTGQVRKKKVRKQRNRAGDIVVTGKRRSEALQDAPIAISAMTADSLAPAPPPPPPPPAMEVPAPVAIAEGAMAQQEELGDLKLYRVPMRVTVAAQSQKQVAMLNQPAAVFRRVYRAGAGGYPSGSQPMALFLSARNVKEQGLGLSLPAGSVALFEPVANRPMLVDERALPDLAVGQDVDFPMGSSPDVQWTLVRVSEADHKQGWQWTVTNAKSVPIRAELIVPYELAKPNMKLERGQGGWILPLDVPANNSASLNYVLKTDL
jgi:hypothetical protein